MSDGLQSPPTGGAGGPEARRLARLKLLAVLDSQPEPLFDSLARLASQICGTPIALVSLIDADRQWFKANVGLEATAQTPRDVAFCAHAIEQDERLMEVTDAHGDARFSLNPMVLGAPHIRFYAGAQITMPGGERMGTLCVIDRKPRTLTQAQREALATLADAVAQAMLLREQSLYLEIVQADGRYRAMADASPLGMFHTDEHGSCTYTNSAWQAIFGLQGESSLGRAWMEVVHPQDRETLAQAMTGGALAGGVFGHEFRLLRRDGCLVHVEVRARGVSWGTPPQRGFVGAVADISERKQMDAALREARAQAEAANQAKSRFLATMTHEIRTPLNGIAGIVQLLQGTELRPQQRQYAQLIAGSAQTLLTLVNDFLDVAKIEAGKLRLDDAPFDLRALLAEQASLYRLRASDKSLAFSLAIAPEVPRWINGDAVRLRQVLSNLLSNALKFTPQGSVALSADLTRRADGGHWLRLTVADTGPGIPAALMPRLFQRFEQADDASGRHAGGTGLGLAIVRELAQLMGGQIEVASAPGAGACFTLWLPSRPADVAEPHPLRGPQAPAVADPGPQAGARRGRILLAEDNPTNQIVAVGLLDQLGQDDVTVVANGRLALEAAQRQPFELIFMDCQMPEMDGYEATRALRAGGCTTPIVAMTANAVAGDRERCLRAGMNDYLNKPVETGALATVLRCWLPMPAPAGQPHGAPAAPGGPASGLHPDFDRAGTLARLDGDAALALAVTRSFESNAPPLLDSLAGALALGDVPAARAAAHTLVGGAAAAGAQAAVAQLRTLEAALQSGDLAAARDLHAALPAALSRFAAAAQRALTPPH